MKNFWEKQKKGFLAMAPLAGITDSPFRQMCKKFGADILYSEMASAAALYYDQKSKKKTFSPTLNLLKFQTEERPFVVQLFGSNPKHFEYATKIINDFIKPDGIDINFGCPVKKIRKQGAGSALMENFKNSREVIKSVINNTNLPVSIKTRAQVNDKNILEFLENISDLNIQALMLHGRSLKEGFGGKINMEISTKIKNYFEKTYLINGFYLENNQQKYFQIGEYYENLLKKTKADGIGIGRIALGRPWIFKEIKNYFLNKDEIKIEKEELKKILKKHLRKSYEFYGEKSIFEIRKHIIYYFKGFKNGSMIRQMIFQAKNYQEIYNIIDKNI